jgi:hypothetical protein
MKTALSIIGIVFLVLLACLAGLIGIFIYVGASLDASSKSFVDESVPAIVANWSEDELTKRESAQFRKITSDEALNGLFTRFRALGPMQTYDGSTGQANLNVAPATGLEITASYLAETTFQNGKAEIRVNLIRVDGVWQIYGFRIDSPLFSK